MATEFLDPLTQQIRVPTRESFVGRRQLQNCLRALTQSPDRLGVLIHGMGGLGKSSLAARLCDRLPQFNRLVWQRAIDEARLVRQLAAALDDRTLRQRLKDPQEELRFRLRGVFTALAEQAATPFLLVLDDFEQNLEPQGTGYRLKPPAAALLNDLIWAIRDVYAPHRLILTSRYDFEWTQGQVLYRQAMDAFQGADLQKKCERLSALKPPELPPEASEADKQAAVDLGQLQEQAKRLADGNPRLLETLNRLQQLQEKAQRLPDRALRQELQKDEQLSRQAQPALASTRTLEQLEQDPTELRQQVIEDRLLQQMAPDLQAMLSRGLIFELPVPRPTFESITLPPTNPPPPTPSTAPLPWVSWKPALTTRCGFRACCPWGCPLTPTACVLPLPGPFTTSGGRATTPSVKTSPWKSSGWHYGVRKLRLPLRSAIALPLTGSTVPALRKRDRYVR
ncbi:AAA family ATPase [Leptothermofonsia sichuanensis E412]|uniref:ATP-binding protein n=1 Tax=Leptothermofonsia sichuanensis TaxID=2917832 RepID=UPI001CA6639E|nr:AAA family ATPase [Leptothermofonsia sichuanensis]QZZ20633.1 AAA family ATPase [Leptothermofonsia sichuanensis E412]